MKRRTSSSLRAAASGAVVESLELRRLLSYQPGVEILADTPQAGELFGSSIATSGSLALVGAPQWDGLEGTNVGRAFLINLSDPNNPVIEHVFTNPEPEAGDQFGAAVAWVNGKIAISTPEGSGPGAGAVYVYDDVNDTTPLELVNPTGSGLDSFGGAMTSIGSDLFVSLLNDGLGNSAVVQYSTTTGATIDTHTIPSTGIIALAAKDGLVLTTTTNGGTPAVAALDPFDGSLDFIVTNPAPLFGVSIAVTDNSVLISSPFEQLVYEYFDDTSTRTFAPPPGATPGLFGFSLAVSGDKLLVGDSDGGATSGGEAHVFDLTSGNPVALLVSAAPANSAEFGAVAAALPNGGFLVGDPFSDMDNNFGAVYAFTPTVTQPTGPSIEVNEDGDLVVVGSAGADAITITKNGAGQTSVVMGALSAIYTGGTIIVHAGDGDDVIGVSSAITADLEIHAGAGNDSLSGGAGNDVLVGDAGDDVLYGHTGRDLMIGGGGADALYGEVDDDILIAGSTVHDNNSANLAQIMAIWTSSTLTVEQRIATLSGGLLASSALTVINDDQIDTLTGRNGDDWFFVSDGGVLDVVTDLKKDEDLAFIPLA